MRWRAHGDTARGANPIPGMEKPRLERRASLPAEKLAGPHRVEDIGGNIDWTRRLPHQSRAAAGHPLHKRNQIEERGAHPCADIKDFEWRLLTERGPKCLRDIADVNVVPSHRSVAPQLDGLSAMQTIEKRSYDSLLSGNRQSRPVAIATRRTV